MSTRKGNKQGCIPARYIMVLLASGGTFVQMNLKTSMSATIVAMVKTETLNIHPSNHTASGSTQTGDFDWSSTTQGFVLSAFFYGYITTQVLSGWLAERVGAKIVMGCGLGCAGIFTLVGPFATNYGAYSFAASRILVGICTGMFFPPQQSFVSKWIPPEEYQMLSGIMNACSYLSVVVAMTSAGLMSSYSWRLVFYVDGCCAILWSVLWLCLARETPALHPFISHEEFIYITKHAEDSSTQKLKPIPWLSIFTCVPVWAQISVHVSGAYLSYTVMSEMPTYMKNILHVDNENSGIISSLPHVFGGLSCTIFGLTSQWLQTKGILSHLVAYKIFNGIFAIGGALCLCLVPVAGGNKTVVVALLVAAMVCYNAYSGGSFVNMMDLAINYVGVLTGIMQTFANSMGIVSAQVAGLLTDGQQTADQWAKVFYIAGGITVPSYIFYWFYGSVEEQEWNQQGDEEISTPVSKTSQKTKKLSLDQFI